MNVLLFADQSACSQGGFHASCGRAGPEISREHILKEFMQNICCTTYSFYFPAAMAKSKGDGEEGELKTLAKTWFDLPGLADRGAGGRLVIAPATLTRQDLEHNWDVVGHAMLHMGARPCVDKLQEEVEAFFELSRPKGKKPVTSYIAELVWVVCMLFW